MKIPDSTTRRRPPDGLPSGSPSDQQAVKRRRIHDEIQPECRRSSAQWKFLQLCLRDALAQVRALIFVHVNNEKKCLRIRGFLQAQSWLLSWMAVSSLLVNNTGEGLEFVLGDLGNVGNLPDEEFTEATKTARVQGVLASLLAHVLLGHVSELKPLLSKLSPRSQRQLERVLGASVRSSLASLCPQQPLPRFKSWFRLQTQPSLGDSNRSLIDLSVFAHTKKWACDEAELNQRRQAYDHKRQRAQNTSNLTIYCNALKEASGDNTDELSQAKEELKMLKKEEQLMIRRVRKYRLFPTREQQHQLRCFMGTCRWTYNQAVAHFKKTNEYRADRLRVLYVARETSHTREYPEDMDPPPDWVFGTPQTFRYNTLRKFQTGVKSAFSNLRSGNVTHFQIAFKSKKDSRFFTFCEDGRHAKIKYADGKRRALLSISGLKNIPIRCNPGLEITNEIQIMNTNGFWYAVIPQFVRPGEPSTRNRCIALDPGLKAFLTGVDLNGNVVHVGRDSREHLTHLKNRASRAQQEMAQIKNSSGRRSRKQWRAYTKAKRAFNAATAKLKNCVKEMHYQACSYLTTHYDTIIIPIFRTKEMMKKSRKCNHTFNGMMLSLNHFRFRQLLKAKCQLRGKSLVVCSEMYTSMTCGKCGHLHLSLGSNDVFHCPRCEYVAGRDVNAAFNILRFVCGGSLEVFADQGFR